MIYRFLVVNPKTGLADYSLSQEFDNDAEAVQWATAPELLWWKRNDIYIAKQLTEDSCGPVSTIAKLIHQF